ncbi:short-chain dehydrogenase [Verrucomicrobia bacterium LW23]|nr:short-chain dehydrogenase [Verrucomicrobia bacterium LW23]
MAIPLSSDQTAADNAYIITGPTSGIGRCVALELAVQVPGTIVLVGRNAAKLDALSFLIDQKRGSEQGGEGGEGSVGRRAIPVVCDFSDIASVRRAAAEIIALGLPIAGLLNNAGLRKPDAKSAQGWDLTFATNHLGAFALTEALVPHLPDGAQVLFVGSATEDPDHEPAKTFGIRGARYISAEASARGEWMPGGSSMPAMDAYATSKQCNIVTARAFAREMPRLRFNVVEPGFIPNTGLHREAGALLGFLADNIMPLMAPFMKHWSNPQRAGRVITKLLTATSAQTGVYYNQAGLPMQGSALSRNPSFADRVVAETRALLAAVPAA